LRKVTSSWTKLCTNRPRIVALAKASAVAVVRPPSTNIDDTSTSSWAKELDPQEMLFESRFKSQVVRGINVTDSSSSWKQSTKDIFTRASASFRLRFSRFSDVERAQFTHSQPHPSILKSWVQQGAKQLQKVISPVSGLC
jgi:hypothetical protein